MQYLLQILHLSVKFNDCLVTKPLGVFSSETKWLNASLLFLRMNHCLLICTMFTCFYLLRDNNITINVHQTRVQRRFYFVNSSNVYEHVFISISTAGSLYISHGKDCWQNIWQPWHHIRTERYDICPKTSSRKMVLKKK